MHRDLTPTGGDDVSPIPHPPHGTLRPTPQTHPSRALPAQGCTTSSPITPTSPTPHCSAAAFPAAPFPASPFPHLPALPRPSTHVPPFIPHSPHLQGADIEVAKAPSLPETTPSQTEKQTQAEKQR